MGHHQVPPLGGARASPGPPGRSAVEDLQLQPSLGTPQCLRDSPHPRSCRGRIKHRGQVFVIPPLRGGVESHRPPTWKKSSQPPCPKMISGIHFFRLLVTIAWKHPGCDGCHINSWQRHVRLNCPRSALLPLGHKFFFFSPSSFFPPAISHILIMSTTED